MKKNDKLLIIIILSIAILSALCVYIFRAPSELVKVYVDNELVEEFSLHENTQYLIHASNGGTNLLVIEDGKVFVKEASCPDKVCMQTDIFTEFTHTILCLPNNVTIVIEGYDQ